MDLEEANPYDGPILQEAWRRGWRACLEGKARPEEILFDNDGPRATTWKRGYKSCETGGPEGFD